MNHLGTVQLKTDRLILRRFMESDAEGIFHSFVNDAGFLYYANKEARSLAQEKESLKGIDERYENKDYYNWLITLKDGAVIGAINLNVEDYNESLEFNYAVDDRHRGNGYMTEALLAVREFAVNELRVNRFFGGCEIDNHASACVMEKCGLRFEGILRNHLKLSDGYHDMRVYSFIRGIDSSDSPAPCDRGGTAR